MQIVVCAKIEGRCGVNKCTREREREMKVFNKKKKKMGAWRGKSRALVCLNNEDEWVCVG
jgi:hypothetical protein